MIIDFAELDRMLDTFTAQDAMRAVGTTRRLAQQNGAVITKGDRAVPTNEFWRTYRRRAKNPRLSAASADECVQMATLAEQYPDECWHIYIVKIERDEHPSIAVAFANEAGIGRICFDPDLAPRR